MLLKYTKSISKQFHRIDPKINLGSPLKEIKVDL